MDLLPALDLEPREGGFTASSITSGAGSVVFGGQLLAQVVVAAARTVPDKQVLSLQCVFARGARSDEPLEIDVEKVANGRAFATVGVTITQGGKVCVRATVLLHAPDPDLIRHQDGVPRMVVPSALPSRGHVDWWDVRFDPRVDLRDPAAIGPPELDLWSRFPEAPSGDPVINQALLAYASDLYLIATAMRPHPGVGQALAHVEISTTVLSQTIVFHEPFDASDWLVMSHRSTYAGRGRSHGSANVFDAAGRMVASFSQVNMIRAFPEGQQPGSGQRSAH